MRFILLLAMLFISAAPSAEAVNPNEMLSDPVLEERAREISKGLRCVVCQNQSIDDSDASLAKDLRVLVRERLTKGDSNEQVVSYIVSRYGDFVLLKPPFNTATLALWLGPMILIVIGLLATIFFFRRSRLATATTPEITKPLDDKEQKRLAELLAEEDK